MGKEQQTQKKPDRLLEGAIIVECKGGNPPVWLQDSLQHHFQSLGTESCSR